MLFCCGTILEEVPNIVGAVCVVFMTFDDTPNATVFIGCCDAIFCDVLPNPKGFGVTAENTVGCSAVVENPNGCCCCCCCVVVDVITEDDVENVGGAMDDDGLPKGVNGCGCVLLDTIEDVPALLKL